jgi:outer membrane murein-binding lipoprotein Lpp
VDSLPALALAGLSVVAFLLARRVRALLAEVSDLQARVDGLASRLAAAEEDVQGALARTEVAETVLLEKGLADEEDLEAARRLTDAAPGGDVPRDDLH